VAEANVAIEIRTGKIGIIKEEENDSAKAFLRRGASSIKV
jgi:hypothetical protein